MKIYEYYKIARDKAWKVLIECEINRLPIDLIKIANFYNIKIKAYSKNDYPKTLTRQIQNGDGFSKTENGKKVIYFNDKKGLKVRRRFTIAHELGHCLLEHDLNNQKFYNSEIDLDNMKETTEIQANIFARNILMPAIVLHYINAIHYEDIMKLCNVSETSAKIREKRMLVLEARNKFCISYLEKQVYNNFTDFINKSVNP